MTGPAQRVLVAGTGGGVGTTTLTALLFARLRDRSGGAPRLLDHTGGSLGARLPDGDEVRLVDELVSLHDLGPLALAAGVPALADPAAVLVVVSAATPVGVELAVAARTAVGDLTPEALSRTVLVLVEVFGRHRLRRELRALTGGPQPADVLVLREDPALAAGGRIRLSRLSPATLRSTAALLDAALPERVPLPPLR
ncbi:hypothetical protein [uncultured Friedmanniella sp.]|uniref:hypothetical protein n=1 Tax=uncultured Friedmanniella sp. TaxID=335381 RepID=UPI0035C9FE05